MFLKEFLRNFMQGQIQFMSYGDRQKWFLYLKTNLHLSESALKDQINTDMLPFFFILPFLLSLH